MVVGGAAAADGPCWAREGEGSWDEQKPRSLGTRVTVTQGKGVSAATAPGKGGGFVCPEDPVCGAGGAVHRAHTGPGVRHGSRERHRSVPRSPADPSV